MSDFGTPIDNSDLKHVINIAWELKEETWSSFSGAYQAVIKWTFFLMRKEIVKVRLATNTKHNYLMQSKLYSRTRPKMDGESFPTYISSI
jgi:hypothetical protein